MLQGFSAAPGGSRRAGIVLSVDSGWCTEVAGQDALCLGIPSEPWLRVALTSLRSLLQARGHNGAGGGMVACWERESWPHRSGAPGGGAPQNLPGSFWHWPLAVLMPSFMSLVKLLH